MLDRLTALFEPSPRSAEGWVVRMARPAVSRRDQKRFETWLGADPDRLDAYLDLKTLIAETGALRATFVGDLDAIAPARRRPARARVSWPVLIAPAFGGMAAVAALLLAWPSLSPFVARDPWAGAQTIRTATGEIRDVRLADGSKVTLDTATTIRVRVEGRVRRVSLDGGGAYFEVAHDQRRPFQVSVGDRKVVVTGTRFATVWRAGDAQVAVLAGGVAVTAAGARDADPRHAAAHLVPGDQVSYRAGQAMLRQARIDPSQAAPWRERRLIFQDVALSQVLATLSRYTDTRLKIADPALGRQRVTAIFPLNGGEPVIDAVDRLFPVTLSRSGPGEMTVRAEPADGPHRTTVISRR